MQAGKTTPRKTDTFPFSHYSHVLVTLHVQFFALIGQNLTGEFMRKNSFSILKLVCFVTTCDVFNCLFPLDVENEIQLLSSLPADVL